MSVSAVRDIDQGGQASPVPLVVDLDGTLIRSDLLVESGFAYLGARPWRVFSLLAALRHGRSMLKAEIAASTDIDAQHLPYDSRVLDLIEAARAEGREVYLASASNERYVHAVSDHLNLFDGVFASSEHENLSSSAKAVRLVERFGKRGFDYIGNDKADLAVWAVARRSIAVQPSAATKRTLLASEPGATVLEPPGGGLRAWLKLLRVHQWSKNVLVFVAVGTSHQFGLATLAQAVAAFLCFSIAASGIYILNDLVDVEADRKHPSKKRRPLAAGTVPILQALAVAPLLVIVSLAGALAIGPMFAAVLGAYLCITTAYTFYLKRQMMVDIITLAGLYTIRVIGGAAAIAVPVSQWLLGFAMLMFISLALIKRYVELAARLDAELPDPTNRDYRKTDLDIVAAMAAAAGFNSVTVFALYVSSTTVSQLYRYPGLLWLVCPLLIYFLGRALMMAHRRLMNDDPIIYAMKDRNSLITFALIGIVMLAAI